MLINDAGHIAVPFDFPEGVWKERMETDAFTKTKRNMAAPSESPTDADRVFKSDDPIVDQSVRKIFEPMNQR